MILIKIDSKLINTIIIMLWVINYI